MFLIFHKYLNIAKTDTNKNFLNIFRIFFYNF